MTAKETSLAFVERMESVEIPSHSVLIDREDFLILRRLAKTSALIEEHGLMLQKMKGPANQDWIASLAKTSFTNTVNHRDSNLHTAVRAVADKIKEGS